MNTFLSFRLDKINSFREKMSKLENDYIYNFFSYELIIQLVRLKNENIWSLLNYNENFILF